MTRFQKKCFIFSLSLHGLLGVILIGSSAFSEKPPATNIPILTVIPRNIVDGALAGGGTPITMVAPQPQRQAPTPAPAPAPQPPAPTPPLPEPVTHSQPKETASETTSISTAIKDAWQHLTKTHDESPAPESPKPAKKKPHHIDLDYTPVNAKTKATKTNTSTSDDATVARIERKNHLKQIETALDGLAEGVKTSGAKATVVDMPGQGGGGPAFAGYETVIFNYYYRAWTAPDDVADKLAGTDVKIVVARDGSIISAEIVGRSGHASLDKSVERALRKVTKLPAFPETAHDEQRSFLIKFNLDAKESSG